LNDKSGLTHLYTGNLANPSPSVAPHSGGLNIAITHFVGTRDGHIKYHHLESTAYGGRYVVQHTGDGLYPDQ
jgi:hypothetical protein